MPFPIGMAFGTGSAIARRAVDAIVGPGVIQHETVASATPVAEASDASRSGSMGRDACSLHSKAFQDVSTLLFFCSLFP